MLPELPIFKHRLVVYFTTTDLAHGPRLNFRKKGKVLRAHMFNNASLRQFTKIANIFITSNFFICTLEKMSCLLINLVFSNIFLLANDPPKEEHLKVVQKHFSLRMKLILLLLQWHCVGHTQTGYCILRVCYYFV